MKVLSVKFLFVIFALMAVFVYADADSEQHDGEGEKGASHPPADSAHGKGASTPPAGAPAKPESKIGKP